LRSLIDMLSVASGRETWLHRAPKLMRHCIALHREQHVSQATLQTYLHAADREGHTALQRAAMSRAPGSMLDLLDPLCSSSDELVDVTQAWLDAGDENEFNAFWLAVRSGNSAALLDWLASATRHETRNHPGQGLVQQWTQGLLEGIDSDQLSQLFEADSTGRSILNAAALAKNAEVTAFLIRLVAALPASMNATGVLTAALHATAPEAHVLLNAAAAATEFSSRWTCVVHELSGLRGSHDELRNLWLAFVRLPGRAKQAERAKLMLGFLSDAGREHPLPPSAQSALDYLEAIAARRPQPGHHASENAPVETFQDVLHKFKFNEWHTLYGEVKDGVASGFHALLRRNPGARIRPGTLVTIASDGSGVFSAFVDIWDRHTRKWIPKEAASTFFPDGWSRRRSLQEIADALTRCANTQLKTFTGRTSSGVTITCHRDTHGLSVYPRFP
jgi:hypothetical protein